MVSRCADIIQNQFYKYFEIVCWFQKQDLNVDLFVNTIILAVVISRNTKNFVTLLLWRWMN